MKMRWLELRLASAALVLAACAPSQPAETDTAARVPAPPRERVQLTPEARPVPVTVTAVGRDGKPMGDARTVQLTAVTGDPRDLGLVPVSAGAK